MLRYYDTIAARYRFKPRYVWAACAFLIGVLFGVLLVNLH